MGVFSDALMATVSNQLVSRTLVSFLMLHASTISDAHFQAAADSSLSDLHSTPHN